MADLVSGQGASKWGVNTPSPGLIKQEIKEELKCFHNHLLDL